MAANEPPTPILVLQDQHSLFGLPVEPAVPDEVVKEPEPVVRLQKVEPVQVKQEDAGTRSTTEVNADSGGGAVTEGKPVTPEQELLTGMRPGIDKMVTRYIAESHKATADQGAVRKALEDHKPQSKRRWSGLVGAVLGIVILVGLVGWLTGAFQFSGGGNQNAEPTATLGSAAEAEESATPDTSLAAVPTEEVTAEATAEGDVIVPPTRPSVFSLGQMLESPTGLPGDATIDALAFSDDATCLAALFNTGSSSGQVSIWAKSMVDRSTYELGYLPERLIPIASYDRVHPEIAFFPGEPTNVSEREIGFVQSDEVKVVKIGDPSLTRQLSVPDLLSGAVSPNGQLVATGSRNGGAALWWADSGERVKALEGHTGDVQDVTFSSSGGYLATTQNGETRVWNGFTGDFQYAIKHNLGNDPDTTKVAFSHEESVIAVCSGRASCGFWNVSDGSAIGSLDSATQDLSGLGKMLAIGFTEYDGAVAIGWESGAVQLWTSGALTDTLRADPEKIGSSLSAMSFSSDVRFAALGLSNGEIQVWQLP